MSARALLNKMTRTICHPLVLPLGEPRDVRLERILVGEHGRARAGVLPPLGGLDGDVVVRGGAVQDHPVLREGDVLYEEREGEKLKVNKS